MTYTARNAAQSALFMQDRDQSKLLGEVITFGLNHRYKPGDTIRVYWKQNNKNKLNFIEEKYHAHDAYLERFS